MIYMMYILILYVLVWVRLCYYAGLCWTGTCVSSGDKGCIQKQKEGRVKEREGVFECMWRNSFIFTPESQARSSMPIHFLELASASMGQRTHRHTHKLGSLHATVKALQSCSYTQRNCHTHTDLAHWDDSEEMASSSWGVPSLLYRNCSTLEAFPHPVLSLCACMHISVGVWCAVCLCAG